MVKLNSHRSTESDEMNSWVLGDLADLAKPISNAFEKSWQIGKFTGEWKKRNIISSILKKGGEKDLGNYGPVSLSCVLEMILE